MTGGNIFNQKNRCIFFSCRFHSQSNYLRHLDTRKNLDSFLLKSDSQVANLDDIVMGEELRIDQIQQIIENEHMTKEREKEILRISKSIVELNSIFKGLYFSD